MSGDLFPDVTDHLAELSARRRVDDRHINQRKRTIMSEPEIGDDDFDTGCTDGCADPCWADHQGEQ